MRRILYLAFVLALAASLAGCAAPACRKDKPVGTTTFTLWQLPNQTNSQIMSYVLQTKGGKLIVIDGGVAGDAPYLREFLRAHGNRVDVWFLTHPHDDHMNAMHELVKNPDGLTIGPIYASMPDRDWVNLYCNEADKKQYAEFVATMQSANRELIELRLGQTFRIDGVRIEVLGVKNPEFHNNPLNNSSAVLRVWDSNKSVLFLGDLGYEGGNKLLASPYAKRLHCDYVQMAHHGQNGVSREFYRTVNPTYCLWPTPKWLWDNDSGGGKGSGKWKTLEVREWMSQLPVKQHYVMCEGLQTIE
ncbi:MAG: MBL fold metallo-hydrolase [Candidatus Hydrogenedentes bacterium]|nr:MBL fold metallo-hydrolase [Candidatus Hydrogenedentota bacterium]